MILTEKHWEMAQGVPYRFRAMARELQSVRLETMEGVMTLAMFGYMSGIEEHGPNSSWILMEKQQKILQGLYRFRAMARGLRSVRL